MSQNPIQVEHSELGPCHHRLSVTVPAARVREEYDHALRAAARGLKIKGFRPGKAPAAVVRQLLGDAADEQAREHLFEHVVPEAIARAGIEPLRLVDFDPSAIEVAEDADLSFEVEVESAPVIDLPPWEEVEVLSQPTEATEEQIAQAIASLGRENPRFDDAESESLDDQTLAECDLCFVRDGEEGPQAEGLMLGLSAPLYGAEPEEFEQAMRGARAGDERTVPVAFNEGFERKDWIGSRGEARIRVRRLVVPRPASAAELAEMMGLAGGEEALREEAVRQITAQNEQAERQRQIDAALDAILELRPFDLPNRLVEEEARAAMEAEIERLVQAGTDQEEAAEQVRQAEDELRRDALRRLRRYFLIRRIAAAEKIRVGRGDLEAAYRQIGARHGADAKVVRSYYEEKGLDRQLAGEILETKVRAAVGRILERRAAAVESEAAAE